MTKPHDCVYRLATATEWLVTDETGIAPTRPIDKQDGYIHLSTAEQVLDTANLHFADAPDLLALEIPLAPIAAMVKFERAPKRGEDFPHLYGVLRREHVSRVLRLMRSDDGFYFGEAL